LLLRKINHPKGDLQQMNVTHFPEVRRPDTPIDAPAAEENLPDVILPVERKPSRIFGFFRGFFGLMSRWLIGALFCMNYFASVALLGWTYRWMQARALKIWWKQSRFAKDSTFRE
jgi:hypothetical protein